MRLHQISPHDVFGNLFAAINGTVGTVRLNMRETGDAYSYSIEAPPLKWSSVS
jgi:hypothetical protein